MADRRPIDGGARTQAIAAASIAVALVVLAIKTAAWWITGSVALYSDALESVVNVAAALIALMAIRWARKPADREHPYGHHKAEYFAAVLEGVAIVVAALVILAEAWSVWREGRMLTAPVEGVLINAVAGIVNGAWCWLLLREGRALRSPALLADGRHLFADVVSSVGVTAGVLVAVVTGQTWLDPLLACLVALNILWSGWVLMRDSLGGLMDAAPAEAELALIRETIARNADGAIEAHDLRARHAGRATFLEFHLVVPGRMTVDESHAICDRIEQALKAELPGAIIAIHVEPEEKAKQQGITVL